MLLLHGYNVSSSLTEQISAGHLTALLHNAAENDVVQRMEFMKERTMKVILQKASTAIQCVVGWGLLHSRRAVGELLHHVA